jgi:hypothetical protein
VNRSINAPDLIAIALSVEEGARNREGSPGELTKGVIPRTVRGGTHAIQSLEELIAVEPTLAGLGDHFAEVLGGHCR